MHLSQISLALTRIGRAFFDPDAVIKALFENGEEGAWYDPSDFSTMFQDSAGRTPVTTVGQTVGLILDKSKGLVLGSELVTNGAFSLGITGWTPTYSNDGTTSWDSTNASLLIVSSSNWQGTRSSFTTVSGKHYKLSFETLSDTNPAYGGQITVAVHDTMPPSSPNFTIAIDHGSKAYEYIFVATASTMWIHCLVDSTSGAWTLNIDNISVKELPGNHAAQATSAKRPALQQDGNGKYYLDFDGVDDFILSSTMSSNLTNGTTVTIGFALKTFVNNRVVFDGAAGDSLELYQSGASGNLAMFANGAGSSTVGPVTQSTPNVLTAQFNTSTGKLRLNGSGITANTGSVSTNRITVGAYASGSSPSAVRFYAFIVRGAASTTQEIEDTEAWVADKTGVTL